MNFTIMHVRSDDVAIARESVAQFWERCPDDAYMTAFLQDRHNILLAAICDGEHVGQCIGYCLDRWDGKPPMVFLYSIDVHASYRRHGIGRALVRHLGEVGRDAGCVEMFLMTNASNVSAMSLYQKTGGQRPYSDDVMFEYDLTRDEKGVVKADNVRGITTE